MIRKLMFGTVIVGLVIAGLATQAGAYLLAMPSPTPQPGVQASDTTPVARAGAHAVGVRSVDADKAPIAMTMWYPGVEPEVPSPLAYSYGITLFGSDSSLSLATFAGHATPGAAYDRSEGPYPLVILSPGFAVTPSSYAWLGEHLASHGFVVVAPHHRETLDPRNLWRSAIERPRDILDILARVDDGTRPGGDFEGLIDGETVAVVGHSYGGFTALAAAGARLDTEAFTATCDTARSTADPLVFLCDALEDRLGDMADLAGLVALPTGMWPAVADERIDAVVSIAGDAAVFGEGGLAEITVPVMAVGGTDDTDSPFEWTTRLAYEHTSSDTKAEMAFEGAGHMVFAGGCDNRRRILSLVSMGLCSDPAWDRTELHDLVKHYVVTFLLAELREDPEAMAALHPGHETVPGLTYRAEGF